MGFAEAWAYCHCGAARIASRAGARSFRVGWDNKPPGPFPAAWLVASDAYIWFSTITGDRQMDDRIRARSSAS